MYKSLRCKVNNFKEEFSSMKKEFGLFTAIVCTTTKYLRLDSLYMSFIKRHVSCYYDKNIKEIESGICENQKEKCCKVIWMPWWQGEENMPDVVRIARKSVADSAVGYEVITISRDNIKDYIDIPDYIMEKFSKGYMSVIHLCDYIRVSLLSEYGGIWLDGTVFATGVISLSLLDYEFYSRHYKSTNRLVSNGRWSGYFLVSGFKHSELFDGLRSYYDSYWKKHDRLITYLFLDYLIDFYYNRKASVKDVIDSVPFNNSQMKFLSSHLNIKFDTSEWARVCKETYLHKISVRSKVSDDPNTYYNCLIKSIL